VAFLQTLFVLSVSTFVPLLIYAITKCKAEFDPVSFLWYSRTRLVLTVTILLILAGAITYDEAWVKMILSYVGFDVGTTTTGIGLALSGLLISGIRGNNDKEEQ